MADKTPEKPFVGRDRELDRIDPLIRQWGTSQVVCLYGDGGVGKTRFLQEVRKRYISQPNLFFANTLDFDDRALHAIENVESRIMRNLAVCRKSQVLQTRS